MPNKQHELPVVQQQELNFDFSPQSIPIHIEIIKNEPWVLAKDVCDILGIGNPTESLRNLDDDEKLTSVVQRAGQAREMNFVNESGLYNLIFQSRKPEAKKFRKWVTNEVLPSIRKTGGYSLSSNKFLSGIPVKDIEDLLQHVEQVEHEGQTLYYAMQLMRLLGKSINSTSKKYIAKLSDKGLSFLLQGGRSNQKKWYIKKEAVGLLLNIKPNSIANIAIIKSLKQGGLL